VYNYSMREKDVEPLDVFVNTKKITLWKQASWQG